MIGPGFGPCRLRECEEAETTRTELYNAGFSISVILLTTACEHSKPSAE